RPSLRFGFATACPNRRCGKNTAGWHKIKSSNYRRHGGRWENRGHKGVILSSPFFASLIAKAPSFFSCSTFSVCLPGGDCSPGFRRIFRSLSRKAGAALGLCAQPRFWWCSTSLACFPDISASGGLPITSAGGCLLYFIFLRLPSLCLFMPWLGLPWRCFCWVQPLHSSARVFSRARD